MQFNAITKHKLTMLSLASIIAGTWSRPPRPVIGLGTVIVIATAGASRRLLAELNASRTITGRGTDVVMATAGASRRPLVEFNASKTVTGWGTGIVTATAGASRRPLAELNASRTGIGRCTGIVTATAGASKRPLAKLNISVATGIPVGIPIGSIGAITMGVGSSGRGAGVTDGWMMVELLLQELLLLMLTVLSARLLLDG